MDKYSKKGNPGPSLLSQVLKSSNTTKKDFYTSFGKNKIVKTEKKDGYKFFFNDDEWVMIRPSGTEPVLRTYSEAETLEKAKKYLADCKKTIL